MRSVSPAGRLFFSERVRGRSFSCDSVGFFFCPADSEPRRSGCASGAALRPALACDRAGTARRADPRCSPPSHEALGWGQRLHPPDRPLGSRTLGRHGSFRPRGRLHRRPPVRYARTRTVSPWRQGGSPGSSHRTSRGERSIRSAGASGHGSKGCGSPSGRLAVGCRAHAEWPRTRRAKKNPARRAVNNPPGAPAQERPSRSGARGACRAPAWRIEDPHPPYVLFRSRWRQGAGKASECSSAAGGGTA
jgi:hypothetical protein